MITDLRSIRIALGAGEISGAQLLAPGPGHSLRDRSLSIRLSPYDPEGFICFSHAGDDWRDCKRHVLAALGLPTERPAVPPQSRRPRASTLPPEEGAPSTRDALKLWAEATDPRATLAERYLASRGLELPEEAAGEALRWHRRTGAMLALFRDIRTNEPKAISRTFINDDAIKIGRKFLGPVGGCAVKLDADEEVLGGLHIGEGVETCLAARQIGLKPTWALGSAGAIAAFPVLSGVEALTFLREHDAANARAAEACGKRWTAAQRQVFNAWPTVGKDLNDSIRGSAK